MDTPLLGLLVDGAAVRAMHKSYELLKAPAGRLATFLALTVLATLCYGGA